MYFCKNSKYLFAFIYKYLTLSFCVFTFSSIFNDSIWADANLKKNSGYFLMPKKKKLRKGLNRGKFYQKKNSIDKPNSRRANSWARSLYYISQSLPQ